MEAFVDIDGVTLKYRGASGDIVALQDATLKVQRGEFAAVVGPSGCGKSTLMRLVTGLHKPTAGTIAINGKKVEFRAKAEQLLATVGLAGFGDRYPWELSGGMQQRVSLCRSLIHEPALLMLDEPFAALDAFTREELWCVLRDLWQKLGFTVILVTHDLREATFLADNIHVMSARPGRIVMTKRIDLPRPRDLDSCFEPRFTDIVHELRAKIAEVRKA